MSGDIQDATRQPPRRRLSTRRKILFTSICFVAALLCAEAALRVRAWIKYGTAGADADGQLIFDETARIYVPRPGYEVHSAVQSIRINSLGFRGEEFTREKPANTIRIACVGASTTYCTGATSNEAAWPQQLEKRLKKKYAGFNWQVINAGVPGHRMKDCLANLRHRVLPLQPDLVIFYEANNQMASDTRRLAEERGLAHRQSGALSPPVKFLSNVSLLFHLCYMNLRIVASHQDDTSKTLQGLPENLPDTYVAAIAELHGELKTRNIPLVMSEFAVKYRRDQDRATQIKNADVAFYYMPWMSIDDLLSGMELYNRALVQYAQSNDVPMVRDVDSIPADATHFADCIHLADAGCAMLADRFLDCLERADLIANLMDEVSEDHPCP
jgi:hypothetical protein